MLGCPILVKVLANNKFLFVKDARPVPPLLTGNIPLTVPPTFILPEKKSAVIVPLTCNAVEGSVIPIATLPSLRIVIILTDSLYASFANAISNLVLDLLASVACHFANLKEALNPILWFTVVSDPNLHKCKTSHDEFIAVVGISFVIVNGASAWLKLSLLKLFIVNFEVGLLTPIPTLLVL